MNDKYYAGLDQQSGQCGQANTVRPMNQVEQLEKEVQHWKTLVEEQKTELLNLYRRLDGHDKPGY